MARKNQPLQLYKNGSGKSSQRPTPSDIPCPSWLPERARNAFKQLREVFTHKMGVITEADRHALILLCDAWDEWMEARLIIEKEGMFYETETNQGNRIKRPHPANSRRSDAWNRIRSMLSEFGATPASRSKVDGDPKGLVKKDSYEIPKTKNF